MSHTYKHRGFTLVESAAALFLVGTLTTLCLGFFSAAGAQRKEQFAQLAAEQEAATAMERLATVPLGDLPKQGGVKDDLSPQARRMLPEGRVEVRVDGPQGEPAARRIEVTVYWRPQIGMKEHRARLVAWRYKSP